MSDFLDRVAVNTDDGEILDGDCRYVMLRADVLMGAIRNVPEEQRKGVLQALAEATFEGGSESLQSYADELGDDHEALGWGAWHFEKLSDTVIKLSVRNSPFADGFGFSKSPVCAPIVGLLCAMAERVFGRAAAVAERNCTTCGSDECTFEAYPDK